MSRSCPGEECGEGRTDWLGKWLTDFVFGVDTEDSQSYGLIDQLNLMCAFGHGAFYEKCSGNNKPLGK